MSIDPYKVLGINRDASQAEIRAAYRRSAKKYHPDAGGDVWVFQQVQQAFQMLSQDAAGKPPEMPQSRPEERGETEKTASRSSAPAAAASEPISGVEQVRLRLKRLLDVVARRQLPLQTETTLFILVNMLDFFCTYMLLQLNAIESNPFADYFFRRWGFRGMLFFKLASVVFVCLLAQYIAVRQFRYGRLVLVAGIAIVGFVVVYSLNMLRQQLS